MLKAQLLVQAKAHQIQNTLQVAQKLLGHLFTIASALKCNIALYARDESQLFGATCECGGQSP